MDVRAVAKHNAILPARLKSLKRARQRREQQRQAEQQTGRADREMTVGTRVYVDALQFSESAPTKTTAARRAAIMRCHGAGT